MSLSQYNFTPGGVQQWQTALYALPDHEIGQEALAAKSDFAAWLPVRFSLTADQLGYLKGIDPDLLEHWGDSVSFFIGHRQEIGLVKPEAPSTPSQRSWKRVTSEDTTQSGTPSSKASSATGKLIFTIAY